MPVITRKNGYYPYEEVIFVGPDESGTYTISNSIEGVPQGLDPLEDASMRNFIGEIDRKEDTVFNLDYTDVDPTYREQILRVTGEGLFRKAVYLSTHGEGGSTTGRPQPMPRPGEIHVYGQEIREEGEYRRLRKDGTVVSWEKYSREEVRGKGSKERG